MLTMGAYGSSFVTEPTSEVAVSGFSHPSKPNWIMVHAVSTECKLNRIVLVHIQPD